MFEMVVNNEVDIGLNEIKLLVNEESIERKYLKNIFPRKRKFKKRLRESAIVKPREPIPVHESETDLCIALWRSVIVQALYDISGKGGNIERRLIRAEALAWFSAPGNDSQESDFEHICQLANLSPNKIRGVVREVRENGEEIIDGFNFRTIRRNSSGRLGRKVPKK